MIGIWDKQDELPLCTEFFFVLIRDIRGLFF